MSGYPSRSGTSRVDNLARLFDPVKKRAYEAEKYDNYLRNAERLVDQNIAANACPKAKLEEFKILGLVYDVGFRAVVKAKHRTHRDPCAIKILNKYFAATEEAPHRPPQEKKLQAALDSDFLVALFFAFQDPTNLYLAMEYGPYGDLGHQLELMPSYFSEPTIKFFAAQILLAIEYLHACQVLHRDLKPENVMVFEGGCLKVGDFGLSKKVKRVNGREGRASSFAGTLHFMAPEMIMQWSYNKSVDWWSFGVVIFVMLFKSYPFTTASGSNLDNAHGILVNRLEFPEKRRISEEARDIIKCLLVREVPKRLGVQKGGIEDVKNHAWFDCDFIDILSGRGKVHIRNLIPLKTEECDISKVISQYPDPDPAVHRSLFREF